MRRAWLVGLLLAAPQIMAAEGSWSSQSYGGSLTRGQQKLTSKPVQPASPAPAGAVATRLAWKIHTDRVVPVGFTIQICGGSRCLSLPTLAGERPLPVGFPASGPYRFEYRSTVRGVLSPPLTVLSNEITVGWRSE